MHAIPENECRQFSQCLYIDVSIVPVKIAKRHLLEPDFHGFHRLLFHLPVNNCRVQVSCKYDVWHWISVSISFVLNSFKGLQNFSVGQSRGRYTLIITILRFFTCISWYSTSELDFAISCSASTASVSLM